MCALPAIADGFETSGRHETSGSLMASGATSPRDLLRSVELFGQLDDVEIATFASLFDEQVVPSRTLVYKHGDTADSFFVIREGSVSLYRDQTGKPLQLLARLGPADFFGETGLFDGYQRCSSARTSAVSRLIRIDKDDLLQFLDAHPAVAVKLQIAAARRHSQNVAAALDLGDRHEVRIRLKEPVTMRREAEGEAQAPRRVVLENLSVGGLCLCAASLPWRPDEVARFTLHHLDQELPVAARVSWRETGRTGFAFLDTDADHDARVERFLRAVLS